MKHILDRPRSVPGTRMRRYREIDALIQAVPKKQTQVLSRLPKTRNTDARLRRFLRIARSA